MFAAQQDETNLRPVAVRDNDTEAALDEIGDVFRRLDHGCVLVGHAHMLRISNERVAADGDYDRFHSGRRGYQKRSRRGNRKT